MISSSLRYIFLYQVWLFTRPKFSRKFIQRADVLHTVCFPAFLRFVQNVWKANAGIFFLVYSACMNFFSLNFPLHEFFFCTSPAPAPPPHNFSNGPSLIIAGVPFLHSPIPSPFFLRQKKTRQCFIWILIQPYVHRLYPINLKL